MKNLNHGGKIQNKKLGKLEAIRGVAAVYVVLHHTFSKGLYIGGIDYSIFFRFGQEAVILFFILSGFVIQYAFFNTSDKTFKTFFLKRFLRIFIPVLIVFLVNYLLIAFQKKEIFKINWQNLLGNIFMLQDIGFLKPNVICEPFLGNQPLWSLSYEWWFYMGFFFIVKYFKEKSDLIVYSLSIISSITYLVYPNFFNREVMYLLIWWIGAKMALKYLEGKRISLESLRHPLLVLSFTILVLLINIAIKYNGSVQFGISPYLEFRHFLFAFLAIVIAIFWQKLNWKGFNYTIGIFEPLASISFGIYISHWFLISNATYLDLIIDSSLIKFIIYFSVCVAFSYILEMVIYVKAYRYIIGRLAPIRQ